MKESMRSNILWLCFGIFLLLQGCVNATIQPQKIQSQPTELKQRYFQAKTIAADGTIIGNRFQENRSNFLDITIIMNGMARAISSNTQVLSSMICATDSVI
jgi:hypothetical protein